MINIADINPYVRVAMHSVLQKGYEIKPRIIFDYELIYVEDGGFIFTYGGKRYSPQKGQFIFIRPNVLHSFSEVAPYLSQPHFHFDIAYAPDSARVPVSFKDRADMTQKELGMIRRDVFSGYPVTPFVTFSDKARALELFYKVIDCSSVMLQKARLIELLDMLVRDNFAAVLKQEVLFHPIEKQLKDYIDAGQGFNSRLDDLAKHFNYNKCYLEHLFKKRYGVGIMAYRNEKRMQTAKELLAEFSVTEVSEKLGFSSIYAFSRAYKIRFGISPKRSLNE